MLEIHESFVWIEKLLLAAIMGAVIGFERESHGQSAGIRTNVMVALTGCLLMILSLDLHTLFPGMDANSVLRIDPGRIASYTVAGMGFLGAGAIIKGKGTIRGLTTAATMWLITGVGLSVGAGYVLPAALTTALSLFVLYFLRHLKPWFSHDTYANLSLCVSQDEETVETLRAVLHRFREVEILFINYHHETGTGATRLRLRLRAKEGVPWRDIIRNVRNEVRTLETIAWEESDVP